MRQERWALCNKLCSRALTTGGRVIAPGGGQGGVTMSYLCPNCNSFPLKDYVGRVSGEKPQSGGAQFVEKSTIGSNPNRLLVVQNGESFEQAKVFKAHAVPQGLCANLINALKLLANQQEDGDGLLQNIVTNLGKGSRKGPTHGLLEFIKVDNERALDVGALRRGTGTLKVRKPKVSEGCSFVIVMESQDTLRADKVVTGRLW